MIKHFLKTAIKNLSRDKISSAFSLLGLAVAMGFAFLIILYTIHETSLDRYHKNYQNIYRVNVDMGMMKVCVTPAILASEIGLHIPEVVDVARVFEIGRGNNGSFFTQDDKEIKVSSFKLVDDNFFNVFSFKMIEVENDPFLQKPNDIYISNEFKIKIFGNSSAVGKTITLQKDGVANYLTINGVFENNSSSSFFQPEIIGNCLYGPFTKSEDWNALQAITYAELNGNTKPEAIEKKIEALVKDHSKQGWNMILQPIKDVYLHSGDLMLYRDPKGILKGTCRQ